MTVEEFARFFEALTTEAYDVCFSKMKDYADEADAHHNFRRQAEELGCEPRQVLGVYFNKHLFAFRRWVRDGRVDSEGLRSRVIDLVNYLVLAAAMEEETAPETVEELQTRGY